MTTGGGQVRRIRVRIDYNLRQANAVEAVIRGLVSIGFRETWRSSSAGDEQARLFRFAQGRLLLG
jgi:hypothetical protein